MVITHNTIAGNSGTDTTVAEFDALPAVMNANQWAWVGPYSTSPSVFSVPNGNFDYGSLAFQTWADENGYEHDSASEQGVPLIAAPTYDGYLGAGDGEPPQSSPPSLAVAVGDFRSYATAQLSTHYPASGDGAADGVAVSEIDGATTRGADGTVPQLGSAPIYNNVAAGTPFIASAASGLLAGLGSQLIVALAQNPTYGSVTVNADGSFVYIPALDYSGSDTFVVQFSDGSGGTALETVTLGLS